MKIVYYSVTGNVKRFVDSLSLPSVEIEPTNPYIEMTEDFVLIVPTYEEEYVEPIFDFLVANHLRLKGVIGSGNLNFADLYVFTAKDIAQEYGVPVLYDFEYSGTKKDTEKVLEIVRGLE